MKPLHLMATAAAALMLSAVPAQAASYTSVSDALGDTTGTVAPAKIRDSADISQVTYSKDANRVYVKVRVKKLAKPAASHLVWVQSTGTVKDGAGKTHTFKLLGRVWPNGTVDGKLWIDGKAVSGAKADYSLSGNSVTVSAPKARFYSSTVKITTRVDAGAIEGTPIRHDISKPVSYSTR